jgi:hypothetical protein
MIKKVVLLAVVMSMLTSCITLGNKRTSKDEWSFDNYLLEVQKNTSKQRYQTAIRYLFEIQEKYPDREKIMVNYLIAYNYYSINGFSTAKKYFDNVFKLYDSLTREGDLVENEKFVTLSRILLEKITEKESYFDPYHVREEQDKKGKKISPRKD